ncbi:hypothetical protein INQ51_13895 [Maribellus sp. CM-23]|uniref:hypothetical protein n=1 Tax=Maribellus sp. CM-23 TaxID=2781026 RepID=UPI001F223EA5|nr:hypothetical protein [Maribellus sp. CM-23]MCE4565406.1 hypothetical protein [Maribellus sp. CM-23]
MAGVTVFAQTGTTTPDGLPVLRSATITSATPNVVFSSSSSDVNNAFIINGITVPLLNSGWYKKTGEHQAGNTNYICGDYNNTVYNNFFAVDLRNLSSYGITPPITSAVLHIKRYLSEPASGTFDFTLCAASNSYETINQHYSPSNTTGIAIHNDLGNGIIYANVALDKTVPSSSYEDITINSDGIAAMNASIGSTFVVGGTGSPNTIFVPVPYWAIALVFLSIGLLAVIRFRKRQLAA